MDLLPEIQERRLVVAIDYGTTHTRVAWATPAGYKAKLSEIEVVHNWGDRMSNLEKVPSVISYSLKTNKNEQQWGSDISRHSIAMTNTKLQLDVDDTSTELEQILEALDGMHNLDIRYIKSAEGRPKYTRKGPEEIVGDYLEKIFLYLMEAVSFFTADLIRRIAVDIVVTMPVEWGYRGKNSTFRGLTKAGFNRESFPGLKGMLLISEPEAATIYTTRYLTEEMGRNFLKVGEGFVLCEVGREVVDVISYKVKQLKPTLVIDQVGLPATDKFGDLLIDLAFKKWLQDLIGAKNYQLLEPAQRSLKASRNSEGESMRALMQTFELRKRRFYGGGRDRDMYIDLPKPLENLNLDKRVDGGQITISVKDMQSFFEPCTAGTFSLIYDQLEQTESRGMRLKNVLLVGEFAESRCLQQSMRDSLSLLPRTVELQIPDNPWKATLLGAAIYGVEKTTHNSNTTMSACPRSYGISVDEQFSEIDHDSRDRTQDPYSKQDLAKDQLKWLIKQGDLILSDEKREVTTPIEKAFLEPGSMVSNVAIYTYKEDDLPTRLDDAWYKVEKIDTLEYDLKGIPLKEFRYHRQMGERPAFYVAPLTLIITIAPGALRVQLALKERIIAHTVIKDSLLDGLSTPLLD